MLAPINGWSAETAQAPHTENERRVLFSALGHHPNWTMEIDAADRIHFSLERGNSLFLMSAPGLAEAATYQGVVFGGTTQGNELSTIIIRAACKDTMTGRRLSHTVTIRLDGRQYHGCGSFLTHDD